MILPVCMFSVSCATHDAWGLLWYQYQPTTTQSTSNIPWPEVSMAPYPSSTWSHTLVDRGHPLKDVRPLAEVSMVSCPLEYVVFPLPHVWTGGHLPRWMRTRWTRWPRRNIMMHATSWQKLMYTHSSLLEEHYDAHCIMSSWWHSLQLYEHYEHYKLLTI